jgi:hypothetical protein
MDQNKCRTLILAFDTADVTRGRFGEFPGRYVHLITANNLHTDGWVERSRDEDAMPDFDSEIADVGKRIKILSDRRLIESRWKRLY